MSFDEIRKHQENRRINILKGFSDFDYLHKDSESKNEFLEKGKRMPIGTISNGYKKIAEGRWQKVSSKGLTKKEHDEAADNSRNLYNTERDNYMDMMKKKEGRYSAGDGSDANKHFRDMENHQKESKNLDDKEYDDTHVFKEEIQKANQYADNYQNRKLNRVGQTYGKDGQPESSSEEKQAANANEDKIKQINSRLKELENINSKDAYDESQKLREFKTQLEAQNLHKNIDDSDVPQETQPNQEGQYSTDDLIGFAQEAEDWQLQEFINDASKSGDNSEYMQAQINIAQDELNRRARPTSDIGEGADVDANDLQNQNEQEGVENDENDLPDWNDKEAVKNYLSQNPDVRERFLQIVEDDIFIRPADAIKLAASELKSGGEALQHVEEAKRTLDELHAKLGGVSNDEQMGEEAQANKSEMNGNRNEEEGEKEEANEKGFGGPNTEDEEGELKGYQKFEKDNPEMFNYLETKLGRASEDILDDEDIENNIDDYFDNWRLSGKFSKQNIVDAIKKYQNKI